MCTIANRPTNIKQTIQWGKLIFDELFSQDEETETDADKVSLELRNCWAIRLSVHSI